MDDAEKYVLRQAIASMIDFPSVYMGGPSRGSVRKAIRIVNDLTANYDIQPNRDEMERAEQVKTWRKVPWDSLE
jgi:hypothetical protein